MSPLAQQQQALLQALFEWPAQDAASRLARHARGVGSVATRGLQVYQANGHALAERALSAAYPVLLQLLGDASFADLARALWHAQPPVRGDIAQWGEALAEFIRNSAQLQDEPYLPDVAMAEWALHCCAIAANQEADWESLALLTRDDPATLSLHLAPGLAVFSSAWPLASLLLAHREGQPSLAEVGAQMRAGTAQDVVVWRQGLQPQLRLALTGELPLLRALQSGIALAPALDLAEGLDFSQWLPLAVQTGLVLGACHVVSHVEETTS